MIENSTLKKILEDNNVDAIFVTNRNNIYYLTDFIGVSETEREAFAVITKSTTFLLTTEMYQLETDSLDIAIERRFLSREKNLIETLKQIFSDEKIERIGFEASDIKYSEFKKISEIDNQLEPLNNVIENIRREKNFNEFTFIKKAVRITDEAFRLIKKDITKGVTEIELAFKLKEYFAKLGADGIAFEPIVAFGENSALPHHKYSNKKLTKGIVLIDAAASYKNYKADLTRTYHFGSPDKKYSEIYKLVLKAQKELIEALKHEVTMSDLYKITENNFKENNQYFIHSIGHGVGIDIHEEPHIRNSGDKLFENDIVTIEPGIYIPGWGGIRIEDYCVIKTKNCEVLSKAPKEYKASIIK